MRSRRPTLISLFALASASFAAFACDHPQPATAPPAATPVAAARTAASSATPPLASTASIYPATRVQPAHDTMFGVDVPDPYRWLEDAKSPEVSSWIATQDDFTRARLAKLPERAAIAARMKELLYIDSHGIPSRRGGRLFYSKRGATQEKSIVCVRERDGKERVLIDANAWPTKDNPSLGTWSPSLDGKKIAYVVRLNNADEATTHVLDVDSGKDLPDVLTGTNFSDPSWRPESDGFVYRYTPPSDTLDAAQRSALATLRFHKLGDDPKKDVVLHEPTNDATKLLFGSVSRDGHWLIAGVSRGGGRSDLYFKSARGALGAGGWTTLSEGKDSLYDLTTYRDRFFLSTNEGAPRSRVFAVDPKKPERAAWKEIIGERPDATLTDVSVVGGKLVTTYLKDVLTHVEIHDLDGKMVREVAFPGVGSGSPLYGDKDDDTAYYSFDSYTTPFEIFETSVSSGKTKSFFKLKVPIEDGRFVVEQRFFASKDGTKIPLFLVRAKNADPHKPAPTLLTGYGGFDVSITPGFTSWIFPWLERGGVFAEVSLRGGGEYGEGWHKAGMVENKQNVFDDFAAAAEYLQKEGVTTPAQTVIEGGSNGGLLVAASVTQRPELFGAALCAVPLTDMVRYPKFGAGKFWMAEYGDPADERAFKTLFAYSPYHHVKPGTRYPSVLVLTSDHDDRVDPMHARKLGAALQAATSGGSVLLRIEREAGHGGAGKRSAWVDSIADELAFALAETAQPGASLR